jgi:hypothetical protein
VRTTCARVVSHSQAHRASHRRNEIHADGRAARGSPLSPCGRRRVRR